MFRTAHKLTRSPQEAPCDASLPCETLASFDHNIMHVGARVGGSVLQQNYNNTTYTSNRKQRLYCIAHEQHLAMWLVMSPDFSMYLS